MKKKSSKIKRKNKSIEVSKSKTIDKKENPFYLLFRYLILLGLMFSSPIIYYIMTPLTINSLEFLLKLIYSSVVAINNTISINQSHFIQIISACVAGSAYLLLLILNLTVKMNIKKRIYSLLFSIALLFSVNVLRLLLFSFLLVSGFVYFDFTHKLFWYFLSTVFVVGIWFLTVKIFSIKEIPIYTDIKDLLRTIKKK